VTTGQAATYPIVLDEVVPAAWHHTEQYANIALRLTTAG
jgi:hypothetical protein